MMVVGEWSTAVEAVVAVLTALTLAVAWLGRILWQLDRRQRQHDSEQDHLEEQLDALTGKVGTIERCTEATNLVVERELRPNAGDSIRDRIVRCETILEQLLEDKE